MGESEVVVGGTGDPGAGRIELQWQCPANTLATNVGTPAAPLTFPNPHNCFGGARQQTDLTCKAETGYVLPTSIKLLAVNAAKLL